MSIEQKIAKLLEESKKLQAEEFISEEEKTHTVDIDHMGGSDENAKKHNITLKKTGKTEYSHDATGTKKNLQKFLVKHYDDHKEAKELHPEIFKEETISEEEFASLSEEEQARYELDEAAGCYKKKAMKEEAEEIKQEVKEELSVDVSEDVAALVNGEELTEEFKTKAATIFEAAVVTRVKAEVAKIEEQFESLLAEKVEEVKEGLVEQVDGYLNYVVEQWMTDNELALENGMKTDIMESFIAGMKNVFMEHYIDVPAEKYDLVGELEEQAEEMKAKLDEQLAANVELSKQINEMKRVSSIEEFCADLADTDAEKFKGLAEELAYEDVESFKTKLQTIKENYFGKKGAVDVKSPVTDEPVQLDEEKKSVDPIMAQYLAALKK